MNITEFYSGCRQESANDCKKSLAQIDWFLSHVKVDPRSGDALPQTMTSFLLDLQKQEKSDICKDRLWRIIDHCRESLMRIYRSLNENIHREHAQLPLHSVRELDASCFMKLSNRPGRTIREKVAGNPYIQAVRHFQSIDLTENRLVKAFSERILELLVLKAEYLGEPEDESVVTIQKWLNSEEAKQIKRWDNIPPNNTLLSHRDYRRVWDSWRWLQRLEKNLSKDVAEVENRKKVIGFWNKLSYAYQYEKFMLAEMPLDINFEKFSILPWDEKPICGVADKNIFRFSYGDRIPVVKSAKKIFKGLPKEKTSVCIDLTGISPVYFSESLKIPQKLPYRLVWQDWHSTTIDVFDGDFVYKTDDNETVSIIDLFTNTNIPEITLKKAAAEFANKLKSNFEHENLIWLVPDHLDDFELDIIRRNLNLVFPNAEPLPRSIAAVFENFDAICDNVKAKGLWGKEYSFVVIDNVLGKKNVVKIDVTFDEEVKKKNPASRGIVFARHPCLELNDIKKNGCAYDSIDSNGNFIPSEPIESGKERGFKFESLGKISGRLEIKSPPVSGGLKLKKLRGQFNNVPLWCDYLPELSTRLPDKKGNMHHEFFVGKDKKVQAKRGVSTKIDVGFKFTIPAGKKVVRLPLFKGDGNVKTNYVALLESSQLPFAEDVKCRLDLTYTYGVNDPYELIFIPENTKYRPITVKYFNEKDIPIDISSLPVPEFPPKKSWSEVINENKINIEKFLFNMNGLITQIHSYSGKVAEDRVDSKGNRYLTILYGFQNSIRCYANHVIGMPSNPVLAGTPIFFRVYPPQNGRCTVAVASFDSNVELRTWQVRKPMIRLWNQGRSLGDPDAPSILVNQIREIQEKIQKELSLPSVTTNERYRICSMLSIMHKDAPAFVWDSVESISPYPMRDIYTIPYILGDLTLSKQKDFFKSVLSNLSNQNIAKKNLRILGISIWRHENMIPKMTFENVIQLTDALAKEFPRLIKKFNPAKPKDKYETATKLSNCLDLLFALIRTRKSTDPKIQSVFDPRSGRIQAVVKQIEFVRKFVVDNKLHLNTQVEISNSSGSKEENLFNALLMYLRGEDAANTIQISVNSTDEEDC